MKIGNSENPTTCFPCIWGCKDHSRGSDRSGYGPCAFPVHSDQRAWARTAPSHRFPRWQARWTPTRTRSCLRGSSRLGRSRSPTGTLPRRTRRSRCVFRFPYPSQESNPGSRTCENRSPSASPTASSSEIAAPPWTPPSPAAMPSRFRPWRLFTLSESQVHAKRRRIMNSVESEMRNEMN